MKSYRCVFNYAGGSTTIDVTAADGEDAIAAAAGAISTGDYDRVEVWEGDELLLTKTTRRAWNALGDPVGTDGIDARTGPASATVSPEQPQTPPLASGLPRRAPTLFASSLRGPGGTSPWQRIATRKG